MTELSIDRHVTTDKQKPLTSVFDEVTLAVKPLLYPHRGDSSLMAEAYHRMSGMMEVIGYPSLGRHEKWLTKNLEQSNMRCLNKDVLLCGAMSPISIAQAMEMMHNAGLVGAKLTVVDMSKTPYESAKIKLQEIADRAGILLQFEQSDINTFKPFGEYGTVIADQIYNFIPPSEWPAVTERLRGMLAKQGKFISIIAMYKKYLGMGKDARQVIEKMCIDQHGSQQDLTPSKRYMYAQFTSLINDQVGLVFPDSKPAPEIPSLQSAAQEVRKSI